VTVHIENGGLRITQSCGENGGGGREEQEACGRRVRTSKEGGKHEPKDGGTNLEGGQREKRSEAWAVHSSGQGREKGKRR